MAVTISGMFGNDKTYFADSPVVIDISGLQWPSDSPFNVVRVEVIYDGKVVGDFKNDSNRQSSMSFDISSALRAIWSDYDFGAEVAAANGCTWAPRSYRGYSLKVYTQYQASDGYFTETYSGEFYGGRCAIGGLTEWERSTVSTKEDADVSYREHENHRFGDASTKPTDSPERVGKDSTTSWVDVSGAGHTAHYYSANTRPETDGTSAHAPQVLRDSQEYVDFLFLNRRGAIETCSGLTAEAMNIDVETKQYARVERPSFIPSRSLMAIGTDGRRSWQMSSGYVTREWAEWWAMEFLGGKRKQWWMKYRGRYVPVIVEPSKKRIIIYDRSKQNMPHVDFTVTLALEG